MHMKILGLGQNKKVEYLFFPVILLLGLIFIFAVPPFQKADETAHFLRGVALSNGDFVCEQDENGEGYFPIKEKYFNYINDVGTNRIAFNYPEKFYFKDLVTAKQKSPKSDTIVNYQNFCSLPFLSYLPTAGSVLIGNLFDSISVSFYLSRVVNFVIFFLALLCSYNKIKDSKLRWILLAYGMIPMVTHQASTIGYDALQLAIAPVLFALNRHFIEEKNIEKKDLWIYFISMFVLLTAKPGYYFMSLLYLLIPREKITKDKKKYLLYTGIYFLLVVVSAIFFTKLYSDAGIGSVEQNINPAEQLKGLISNPLRLIVLVRNTLGGNMNFYMESFIGKFGWLDYGISPLVYMMFIISWVYLIGKIKNEKIFDKLYSKTLVLALSVFLTVGFLFGSIYLSWNTVGSTVVSGVQGRYFLILFPFLILLIVGILKFLESNKRVRYALIALVVLYVLLEISYGTYKRYYDYSFVNELPNIYTYIRNIS